MSTHSRSGSSSLSFVRTLTTLAVLGAAIIYSAQATAQSLVSWGNNTYGQNGNGSTTNRLLPGNVTTLSNALTIDGGDYHSLAVAPDGTVWAWGLNSAGQLGDGTNLTRTTPVRVGTLTGVVAVAAGYNYSLALKSDGTVWAWGGNEYGQLGDNTNTNRSLPVRVSGLTGVTVIVAGPNYHSLAVKSDGSVWAWGLNSTGQLGDLTTMNRRVPVQAIGLTNIVSVAAGNAYSLALKADGTIWGWGENGAGQLGNGTLANLAMPSQMPTFTGATAIAAGVSHALALKSDGTVWSWGVNSNGQLGTGNNSNQTVPTQIAGSLSGFVGVTAGNYHSLAWKSDGTAMAWGRNSSGQLGIGSTTELNVPVQIMSLLNTRGIAGGGYHSLAIKGGTATTINNDLCINAVALTEGVTFTMSTANASSQGDVVPNCGSPGKGVWFTFRTSCTGSISISSVGSDFTTVLGVFTGTCGNLTQAEGESCISTNGTLTALLPPDTSFYIYAGGQGGTSGTLRIHITTAVPKLPDLVTQAVVLNKATYTHGEIGTATITIKNQGCGSTGIGFKASVYGEAPSPVECGALGDFGFSKSLLAMAPGVTATFVLPFRANGETLRVFLDSECVLVEPLRTNNQATASYSLAGGVGNDLCTNPTSLTTGTTFTMSTTNATTQGDPIPCGSPNRGVWFTYTPTCSGTISVTTAGSDFDTVLAVFTGNCGNLNQVACESSAQASVNFLGMAGETYKLFAAGNGTVSGRLSILVEPVRALLPDLTIGSFTTNKGSYNLSESASATIIVKNQGCGPTGTGFTLSFYNPDPGTVSCGGAGITAGSSTFMPPLSAGESRSWTVGFTTSASARGNNTLRVFADSGCQLVETQTSNNQATTSYTGNSDLVIESMDVRSIRNTADFMGLQPGTVTITVRNQGSGTTGTSFAVRIYVNSSADVDCLSIGDDGTTTGVLGAGSSRTLTFSFSVPYNPGSYTFRAFVDADCVVSESNEANNQSARNYTVTGNNDLCQGAVVLESGSLVTLNTASATIVGDPNWQNLNTPCGNGNGSALGSRSVWFAYTAEKDGGVFLDSTGSGYTTSFAVYTAPCNDLRQVACDAGTFTTRFNVTAGTTYLIVVSKQSRIGFVGDPYLHLLLTTTSDTLMPDINVQEPILLDKLRYVVSPDATGTATVTVKNVGPIGTSLSFNVAVYAHAPGSANCGGVGASSQVSVSPLAAGASTTVNLPFTIPTSPGTYTLRVFADSGCALLEQNKTNNQLAWEYLVLPAALNDQCSGATVLRAGSTVTESTQLATSINDPTPSCSDGQNGVWFQLTPAIIGTHTLSTFGSDFDTVITIYAGTCDGLEELACKDDFTNVQEQVSLPLVTGQTYYVLVSGFQGATGNLQLLWRQPAARQVVIESTPDTLLPITIPQFDVNGLASGTTTFVRYYNSGSMVTFTAPSVAPSGRLFSQWNTSANGKLASTTPSFSRFITADQTLTAVYVTTSNPPNKPVNLRPTNGSLTSTLTPQLQATAFFDPEGNVHISSRWSLRLGLTGGAVFSTGEDPINKTRITVPPGLLMPSASYSWFVQYKGSDGLWSLVSNPTTFSTTADATISTQTLRVLSSNPNSGVAIKLVTPDITGLNTGTTAFTAIYNRNTYATLQAPASLPTGQVFSQWNKNGLLLSPGVTVTVAMTTDTTLTSVYVPFSRPPAQPVNISPENGATVTTLRPTLTASAFTDPDGNTHQASQWTVTVAATGFVAYRSAESTIAKTSLTVPAGRLAVGTTYLWSVVYKDSVGVWSAPSNPTSFTTSDTAAAAVSNTGTPTGP